MKKVPGTVVHPIVLTLAAGSLLALGCAHNQTADANASASSAGATGATASAPAPAAVPAAAGGDGAGAKTGMAAQGWTAIIEGKPVTAPAIAMGDAATLRAIIREGRDHSQVMDHITHLTKSIGPRLTGSTRLTKATEWVRDQFTRFGLSNVHLEQWGTIPVGFDRGPSYARVLLRDEKKNDDGTTTVNWTTGREMEMTWLAWHAGTNGPVRAKVIKAPKDDAGYEAVKGQLKGAWVLLEAPPALGIRGVRNRLNAQYEQRNDAREQVAKGASPSSIPLPQRMIFDGIAGFISTSRDERVWTGRVENWMKLTMETIPKDVHIQVRQSDYDYLNSRVCDGEAVEVEVDAKATFNPGPIPVYNVVAEVPGTTWPDQCIIISAHLDSWDGPGSEGATDNGTGSMVTLEAARILAAVGAKPKRTVRFICWTGEEQGLLGSKAYVEAHKDELAKISGVFVDDGGTNTQGGLGVPAAGVEMMAAATAPTNNIFWSSKDAKWLNVNIHATGDKIRSSGGSDHASFNAVGVPGFFWDEIGRADYVHGWHTQYDKLDLVVPEYLMQSATNSAIASYNLACADELLPRAMVEIVPRDRSGQPQPSSATPASPATPATAAPTPK